MKQYVVKGAVGLSLALMAIPAIAQKDKATKKEGEQQVIVITRDGTADEKVVIELSPGGKVLINGKEKDDNVSVNITKIKDGSHYNRTFGGSGQNWNFDFDRDRMSLFSEDSNRAMLGITTDMDDKGAEVITVNKESAAAKAGLKKGDVITRIGDKKIEDASDVTDAVRSRKPGDKVDITILRDGKEQKLSATLDRYKGVFMRDLAPSRVFGDVNVTMPNIQTPQLRGFMYNTGRQKLGMSIQDTDDGKGVKVLDVAEEGAAAKAGIKEGDVITYVDDKAVNSTDEITRIMRDGKEKTNIKMELLRDGKKQSVDVKFPRKLKTADL